MNASLMGLVILKEECQSREFYVFALVHFLFYRICVGVCTVLCNVRIALNGVSTFRGREVQHLLQRKFYYAKVACFG